MEALLVLGMLFQTISANKKRGVHCCLTKLFFAPVEQILDWMPMQEWMKKDWETQRSLQALYPEKKKALWEFRRKQGVMAYTLLFFTCILTILAKSADAIFEKQDMREGGLQLFMFGIVVILVSVYIPQTKLQKKQKEREEQLLIDYPEIISKFILLLGAGLTVKGALGRILEERKGEKMRYVYKELLYIYHEMNNGITEAAAFEQLGNRIRMIPYMRFGALVSQNLKKGSAQLIPLLELEATDAFSQRKENARRRGEEASTKMLMPMMIMLGIVMAIIIIPAFMVL